MPSHAQDAVLSLWLLFSVLGVAYSQACFGGGCLLVCQMGVASMIACADVQKLPLADQSVDLVFCSPPYEDARTYGIDFSLSGQAWVDWAVSGFVECLRVCRGLVAWVVEGRTSKFRYSSAPILLMADLHRAGVHLRKPPIFGRFGIAGSGGKDWLRNDYEFVICATNGGRLPWSDNTAMGHPPKWAPGGGMSHRLADGQRVNQWGSSIGSGGTITRKDGRHRSEGSRPSHIETTKQKITARKKTGEMFDREYTPPVLANPGNVIWCKVGGGHMGDPIAHKNEAPFPQTLADFFVKSFCPPGGLVLDPFGGSGTTAAAARESGRRFLHFDIRVSQCELALVRTAQRLLFEPGATEQNGGG